MEKMRCQTSSDDLFTVLSDFDDMFRGPLSGIRFLPGGRTARFLPASGSLRPSVGRSWIPAVESFQRDGKLFLRMELPGVDPEAIKVSVTGDHLEISGEKKRSAGMNESGVYVQESRYGRFQRTFVLPEGLKGEDVTARHEHGVLELTVPLPQEALPRTVQIEVGGKPKKVKAA
jgi:HSP20 family protein